MDEFLGAEKAKIIVRDSLVSFELAHAGTHTQADTRTAQGRAAGQPTRTCTV